MEHIQTEYLGELRTRAKHVKSGVELMTDAPIDNKGKGEFFSPTDLVATALGSCAVTIMGIKANENYFSIDGTKIRITKVMGNNPRRITDIYIDFDFPPNNLSEFEQSLLIDAAENCPVAKSIHPDIKKVFKFNF